MLSIDLHPVFRNNRDIDTTLRTFLVRAAAGGETRAEVICGKGAGKLRARVLTYFRQPHVAKLIAGVDVDPDNDGRIVVRLR
jgi:DNA-nicking Smr family endonuclease